MPDRLKVLYIMVTLPVGGAEQILLNTVRGLDKERFEPVVCCIRDRNKIGEEIARSGIRVVELGYAGRKLGWRTVRDLARFIRQERPDIVHTSLYHANYYGRIAARLARVPVVLAWLHNEYRGQDRSLPRRLINRALSRLCTRIVVVSNTVGADIVRWDGIRPDRIETVYTGIPKPEPAQLADRATARADLGLDPSARVIGTVGRLVGQKNHPRLFRVFRKVLDTHPNARLLLVGGGPREAELGQLADEMGIGDKVIFAGWRRGVYNVLPAFDVFALSSDFEGLGVVVLEAMFAGVPIVSTAVGGVLEVLENDRTGVLVPMDDEDRFAAELTELLADPAKASRLAAAARAEAESKWMLDRYLSDLQRLYEAAYAEYSRRHTERQP